MPNKHFSPSEQRLYDLLPANGRALTTTELTRRFYGRRQAPENAHGVVTQLTRILERKTKRRPMRVERTTRRGPHPIEVRLSRRGKK
jgi:hypothetical protein